jgi:hypothetical protein
LHWRCSRGLVTLLARILVEVGQVQRDFEFNDPIEIGDPLVDKKTVRVSALD